MTYSIYELREMITIESIEEAERIIKDQRVCKEDYLDCCDCQAMKTSERCGLGSYDWRCCDMRQLAKEYIEFHRHKRGKPTPNEPKPQDYPVHQNGEWGATGLCKGLCKDCGNHSAKDGDYWLFCTHFHNFVEPTGFCYKFKPKETEQKEV